MVIKNDSNLKDFELYRVIFNNLSEGVMVANPETGFLIFANKSFCDLFRYESDEIAQVNLSQLSSETFTYIENNESAKADKLAIYFPCLKA